MIRRMLAALVSAEVRRITHQLTEVRAQRDQARRVAVRWHLQARPGLITREDTR